MNHAALSCGRDSACCHVALTIFLFFRDTHEDSLFFLKRSCRLRDACICRWTCKKSIQSTRVPKDGRPPVHTLVWSLHTHTLRTLKAPQPCTWKHKCVPCSCLQKPTISSWAPWGVALKVKGWDKPTYNERYHDNSNESVYSMYARTYVHMYVRLLGIYTFQ